MKDFYNIAKAIKETANAIMALANNGKYYEAENKAKETFNVLGFNKHKTPTDNKIFYKNITNIIQQLTVLSVGRTEKERLINAIDTLCVATDTNSVSVYKLYKRGYKGLNRPFPIIELTQKDFE